MGLCLHWQKTDARVWCPFSELHLALGLDCKILTMPEKVSAAPSMSKSLDILSCVLSSCCGKGLAKGWASTSLHGLQQPGEAFREPGRDPGRKDKSQESLVQSMVGV